MGFEQDNIYPMIEPTVELSDFSGGYKYSESLFDIGINQSPDCQDVYFRNGALWSMDGTSKFDSTVISGAPTIGGLFVYEQESSGTKFTLAMAGDRVYNYSSGWNDITGLISLSGGAQHFGLTFNNIFIGVTSARNAPYKKSGTSNIAALGGSPPGGKVIGRIGEFIVIGNTAAQPSYAYYSNPGDPENGWDKFWDVKSDDTQGLMAVGSLDQRTGYLFKEKTADRIEFTGGLSYQHDRGYLPVGIVAQGTLKKCTLFLNGRSIDVLIGLGDSGVYAFDSSKNPFKISKNIEFKFDRNNSAAWNRSFWSKSTALYDWTRNWYWLFTPSAQSAGEMDELWICDLDNGFAWWPMTPGSAASIAMINDSNDRPQIHVGGYDGFVRKFSASTRNYDGTATNGYFTTKVIDFKKTVRLRQFIPYAAEKGNWNIDFALRWGLAKATTSSDSLLLKRSNSAVYGTGVYGTAKYGSGRPVYSNLDELNYTGRYLQIKFGQSMINQPWNIHKIELPARIIGGRVGEYR